MVVSAGFHQSARALDGSASFGQRRVDQPRGTSAWQSLQPADTEAPPSQDFTLLSRGPQVRVLPGAPTRFASWLRPAVFRHIASRPSARCERAQVLPGAPTRFASWLRPDSSESRPDLPLARRERERVLPGATAFRIIQHITSGGFRPTVRCLLRPVNFRAAERMAPQPTVFRRRAPTSRHAIAAFSSYRLTWFRSSH